MRQHIPGSYSLASGDIPPKRKRGRPRKNLAQAESTPAMPAPDGSKKNKPTGGSGDEADGVLGQVVTGVVDGTFDAGYLLNVKVGDTDTQLRGVVFLPGRFAPITAENDVAPFVKMCKRRAVPFPNVQRQPQPSGSVQPQKRDKQPVEPKDQVPNALAQCSQPSNPQSGISEAPENQYLAVVIPLAEHVPKSDTRLLPSGKVMPTQMEEPKVDELGEVVQENAASKIMKEPNEVEANEEYKAEPEPEPVVGTSLGAEASKVMKGPNEVEMNEESKAEPESEPAADLLTSTLVKGPTVVEANKESKEELAPLPVVDISPGVEVVDKQPKIHDQVLSSDPTRKDLTHDEVKTVNLELNQAPVISDSKSDVNISMEKLENAEGILHEKQSEHAVDVPIEEGIQWKLIMLAQFDLYGCSGIDALLFHAYSVLLDLTVLVPKKTHEKKKKKGAACAERFLGDSEVRTELGRGGRGRERERWT